MEKLSYFHSDQSGARTYTDPRLAFAVEEHQVDCSRSLLYQRCELQVEVGSSKKPMVKVAPRQKFDATSKARNVLHGVDCTGKTVLITGGTSGLGRSFV